MYEFEPFLKQEIITLYLERAGIGTNRHTLPPGMSLSVPIFPFTFPRAYVSSTVTFSILPVNSLSPSA